MERLSNKSHVGCITHMFYCLKVHSRFDCMTLQYRTIPKYVIKLIKQRNNVIICKRRFMEVIFVSFHFNAIYINTKKIYTHLSINCVYAHMYLAMVFVCFQLFYTSLMILFIHVLTMGIVVQECHELILF